MKNENAIINVLPKVSELVQIYFTVILETDNSLNQATINSCTVLYGNAKIMSDSTFVAYDNKPIAIAVYATYNSIDYFDILYTKCVYGQKLPDNYLRLIQHIPKGVFTQGINGEIIGDILAAASKLIDDYYQAYFFTINQVYNNGYSPDLEIEYNGTNGLFSGSTNSAKLFQLLAAASTVHLNSYDLELFISKYIYYRKGISCAVYVDDHVTPPSFDYWILNNVELSILGDTTVLAPSGYQPVITNLRWKIYNASTFDMAFHMEVRDLILRMSRADIGNKVSFSPIVDPVDDGFTLIGPTYPLDPRLVYDKCIQYLGDNQFPLNIIGYYKFLPGELVVIEANLGSSTPDIDVGGGEILGGNI